MRKFARSALVGVTLLASGLTCLNAAAQSIDLCRGETYTGAPTNQVVQIYIMFNGAYVSTVNNAPQNPLPNPVVQPLFVYPNYQRYNDAAGCSAIWVNNLPFGALCNNPTVSGATSAPNNGIGEYYLSGIGSNYTVTYGLPGPGSAYTAAMIVAPYHNSDPDRWLGWNVYDPVYQTSDPFELMFSQTTNDFGVNNCWVTLEKLYAPPPPGLSASFNILQSNSFSILAQTDRYYINMINMPIAPTIINANYTFPTNSIVITITPINGYLGPGNINQSDALGDALVQTALARRGRPFDTKIRDRSVAGAQVFYKFVGSEDVLIVNEPSRTMTWVETTNGGRAIADSFTF